MKYILFFSLMFSIFSASAQTSLESIQPEGEYENIQVKKLYSDSLSTSFLIWVKNEVKPHRHAVHTETVYLLEGECEFTLGEETFTLSAGQMVVIPMNVVHAVKVTKGPMKVLSVQSPEFKGKDRIFVE